MSWDSDRQPGQVALLRMAVLFPVLLIVLVISALRSHDVVGPTLYAGVACLALATFLSGTPSYRRFDQPTMLAIGVLDLVAVLAIGTVTGAEAAGALVAVPALWLGGVFRWRGVALAALAGGIAITLAAILGSAGHLEASVGRVASVATFGMVAAVAMAATINVWVGQVALLEAQGAELATALATVEQQQQHAATIVRAVDVGLATLRPDGSYASLNPRHAELMALAFPRGHTGRAGVIGEIYAGDNQTRIGRARLPSVRALAGESFTDTLWIGEQPATRRAIAVSSNPISDADGAFAGAVIAYHDVTPLMRALQVKDDFIAMVSHELRTPLTSIIGSLELAAEFDEGDAAELPRLLAVAQRNADRLLHLISDLLTAAQPGDVPMRVSPETVGLSELVEQSVRDVSAQAERGGVELTTEIVAGLRLVGDRGRLLQVTDNLLSNAVKYTPPGGHVWVTLRQTPTETLLTVQDTGIGVSEVDQAELFTRFFRGRNAAELVLPGVGLGLVITRGIVEAHGGSIRFASREGVGTTVVVTLPSAAGFGSTPEVVGTVPA